MPTFNDRIRQLLLLGILILLVCTVFSELKAFMPGLLGAITLYILSRAQYFKLIYQRKWKRGWAAGLFIIYYLVLLGLPIYLAVTLISPKINAFLENPTQLVESAKASVNTIQQKMGVDILGQNTLNNSLNKLTTIIPSLLNSTANLITNLAMMLFILYYLLYNGREVERYLNRIIPLKQDNINMLASETKVLVKANALGIPLISIIQGIVAALGYFLFGIEDWAIWGFLTGVFAFFPVVGTMVVWVPLVIYMYATGDSLHATGILLYSVIVTGNIDYVARITIMKRMGDVHPVITILGVIVGLGLFGFIGLVFGPLLVNYILVLFDIYMNEFVTTHAPKLTEEVAATPEEKHQEKKEKKNED